MKTFSVTMTEEVHARLATHLIRADGQEDLCFATYTPSTGSMRSTGLISQVILPDDGDRNVHGNVGFLPIYLERALGFAAKNGEGLALLHSHPWPGWQDMSHDDVVAESRIAPAAQAATGLPFIGMTIGTDHTWSARYWLKNGERRRTFDRMWCEVVRVVGKKLTVSLDPRVHLKRTNIEKQLRTISAWGEKSQENLSRLRIAIVGLGSVGSIVAEILARMGIARFVLIDFDTVETKNLDRLTNVFPKDEGRAKVQVIRDAISRSASASHLEIDAIEYSICEKDGFEAALSCDLIFSCVDRPWPRQVLNFIAYAHLIPVIDGGILVRTNSTNTKIKGADWRTHIVGANKECLECLGQFAGEHAKLEREGLVDDPSYMKDWAGPPIDAHENVYPFSSHLASSLVLQMLSFFLAPSGMSDVGQQMYHFVTGSMDTKIGSSCRENCFYYSVLGRGDSTGVQVYSQHPVAERKRNERNKLNLI